MARGRRGKGQRDEQTPAADCQELVAGWRPERCPGRAHCGARDRAKAEQAMQPGQHRLRHGTLVCLGKGVHGDVERPVAHTGKE